MASCCPRTPKPLLNLTVRLRACAPGRHSIGGAVGRQPTMDLGIGARAGRVHGPRRRAPLTMNREADRPVVPGALAGVRPEPQQGARYVVLDRILRAGEGKILRRLKGLTEQVNVIEDDFVDLTDAELRALTDTYRKRLADGETEDDLLPEAFATVREAAKRTLGQRHFDVQLMGGAALHLGSIAEMKTGEGKTLVGTLPAYLNALSGTGVHVVTVNDYLARRDAEWMGRVHRHLGLTVGVILAHATPEVRRPAYACDITYGTNNEFGFDYLRDNMAWSHEELVQRGHHFAIVDEVDSILIDEARTPLIISGPAEQSARWYTEFARIAPRLARDVDYDVEEGKRTVAITESGVEKVEDQLGIDNLYEAVNTPLVGYLNNSLKAKELYRKDKDYIVVNGEVLIVDDDVVLVLAVELLGLERVVQVTHQRGVDRLVEVVDAELVLNLLHPGLGDGDGALALLNVVVDVAGQPRRDPGELGIPAGALLGRSTDDQRRAGLVDKDRVDLVDDREVVAALHQLLVRPGHVVAQVVEAELVVGAVGDVAGVRRAAHLRGLVGQDDADGEAEVAVHPTHPLGVPAGEVVVDRDHVHTRAGQGVQVRRERADQRLALAGLHLGDAAQVQRRAAHQLHVEVPLAQRALRDLADGGERLGQQVVLGLAVGQALAVGVGQRPQLGIGQVDEVVLDDVDLPRQALEPAQDLAFTGPQDSVQHHVSSSLLRFRSHPGQATRYDGSIRLAIHRRRCPPPRAVDAAGARAPTPALDDRAVAVQRGRRSGVRDRDRPDRVGRQHRRAVRHLRRRDRTPAGLDRRAPSGPSSRQCGSRLLGRRSGARPRGGHRGGARADAEIHGRLAADGHTN